MNTLYYSLLDDPVLDVLERDMIAHKPDRIVVFNELEWDSWHLNEEYAELFNKYNVELLLVLGSYESDWYKPKIKRFNKIQLIHWPTFWANWTLMCSGLLKLDREYIDFKYHFICLNNKNHVHRCALIDQLARNNLLDRGIVTWHRFPREESSLHKYKFQYYDDSLRFIDDNFHTILDSFLIPEQYHQSLLHVIGEATNDVSFLTEKIWLPILFKKPFVVMSIQGFHKHLTDLGFKLYDEIIDYSFDSEPDLDKRAYCISENVKRICEQNIDDLYLLIKDKTLYNYNVYMKLISDSKYVPNLIKERIISVENDSTIKLTFTDPRYTHIGKTTGII